MSEQVFWAIKRGDGAICHGILETTRRDAIYKLTRDAMPWREWRQDGFRVVKVKLREARS